MNSFGTLTPMKPSPGLKDGKVDAAEKEFKNSMFLIFSSIHIKSIM
jgi:hypothetical protein